MTIDRLVIIVAVLSALAQAACSREGGQGTVEAGLASNGSTCPAGGPKAVAVLDPFTTPASPSDPDSGVASPVMGTATFATNLSGVDLTISITGCVNGNGNAYPVRVHEGAACTSTVLQGPDWDVPRGEGIASVTCTGTSGVGLAYYTRPDNDPKPWSVGGPSSSDVVGHVLVIHDPATLQPLACGTIEREADAGVSLDASSLEGGSVARADIRAQIAGLCQYKMLSPTPACPVPEQVANCACTHCGLSACLAACSDYATCLEGEPDACAGSCPVDPPCADCMSGMQQCLLGFCLDAVACAVPTPGGPCSKVEACCAMQGPRAQECLAVVQKIEKLNGDPSCIGLMHDQDFLTHLAYDPPCTFN